MNKEAWDVRHFSCRSSVRPGQPRACLSKNSPVLQSHKPDISQLSSAHFPKEEREGVKANNENNKREQEIYWGIYCTFCCSRLLMNKAL